MIDKKPVFTAIENINSDVRVIKQDIFTIKNDIICIRKLLEELIKEKDRDKNNDPIQKGWLWG